MTETNTTDPGSLGKTQEEAAQNVRTHTIRCRTGGDTIVENYHRAKAIKAMCTECLGYVGDPVDDCTSPKCPLYPFRGRSGVDRFVTEEQKAQRKAAGERLKALR